VSPAGPLARWSGDADAKEVAMSHPAPSPVVSVTGVPPSGGRLVAPDGRTLALRGVALRAEAGGGLARVVLEQRFRNAHPDPLQVTYLLPLPADGVVSAFAFQVGERRVVGEVDRRAAARERFEAALLEGRTAALVEQDRAALFTQEIGNIPAGAEVVAELVIDQRLSWLDDGWEWRFPTVVAPRYLGADGRVADGERVTVDVAEAPMDSRASLALVIRDGLREGRGPDSPSHALRVVSGGPGIEVGFDGEGTVALDRDVVVRWAVAQPAAGLALDTGRPAGDRPHADAAYGLVTLVPLAGEDRPPAFSRDLVVLLDTSGSMAGAPLDQARRVVGALVESLDDADLLELLAFSDRPLRWRPRPAAATATARAEACRWLDGLQAGGGTEMAPAVAEALRPLRADAQRQVVLVTDGLVGFESEIGSRPDHRGRATDARSGHPARAPAAGRGAGRRAGPHRPDRRGRAADDPRPRRMTLDDHLPGIVAGDPEAFARWLAGAERRLRASLGSFAARVDTEAVLQETLLRVWQVAPRFVPDGRPDGLLRLAIRIARNHAVSELRRDRLTPADLEALERAAREHDDDPGPARHADPLLRRAIEECRAGLPRKPALALHARLESGGTEPDEALASGLGMRRNTFLQNITRARRFLLECLGRRGIDVTAELA